MQRELYKRDLAEQIEEKKKLERERKLKEMEIERKIEENVRKEEEKLRLQYEKEQAERNYRTTQVCEVKYVFYPPVNVCKFSFVFVIESSS